MKEKEAVNEAMIVEVRKEAQGVFLENTFTRFTVLFLPAIVQSFSRPFLKLICWFFLRWEVLGVENLKNLKGNAIFAPNHVHEIDSFFVGAALPWFSKHVPLYYVSKPKGYRASKNKFFAAVYGSWIFPIMGAIAIDAGRQDYSKSLWRHVDLLKAGKNICLFPEGRIVRVGEESQVRGGIGYVMEATGLPVVPVKLEGVDSKLTLGEFFLRKRKLRVIFGKPIYFKDQEFQGEISPANFYRQLSQRVMDRVHALK